MVICKECLAIITGTTRVSPATTLAISRLRSTQNKVFSWPSISMSFVSADSTHCGLKISKKKNSRKFQKAKLEFTVYRQLHSIYIEFTTIYITHCLYIISNLLMI